MICDTVFVLCCFALVLHLLCESNIILTFFQCSNHLPYYSKQKSYIDFDEPPVNSKCLNIFHHIIVRRVLHTFLLDENEESDEIENDADAAENRINVKESRSGELPELRLGNFFINHILSAEVGMIIGVFTTRIAMLRHHRLHICRQIRSLYVNSYPESVEITIKDHYRT